MIIVYMLMGTLGGLAVGALLLRWEAARNRKHRDDDLIVAPKENEMWPDGVEEITHVEEETIESTTFDEEEEDGAMQDSPGGQGG